MKQGHALEHCLECALSREASRCLEAVSFLVPKAPIIAHGINNSTELLPLGRGLDEQEAYIRRTLDLIERIRA